MAYFYLVLLYLGFGGGLLLLGISSIPKVAPLRKPLSAATLTLLALVWALSPTVGRWVLSVWMPSSVTGGWLVLDTQPALWWAVLVILTAFSGLLWVTVGERAPDQAFGGALLLIYLTAVCVVLTSGSLLLTLAMWACIDIIWLLVRLTDTADGERVIWAVAVGGGATILLWGVALLLREQGASGLWWLMRPPAPVMILLVVASAMRMGLYPFQVVHAETWGHSRVLTVASAMSPLTGISLLYRLQSLPAGQGLPDWVVTWGAISVLWAGLRALTYPGRRALLPASYGLLFAAVTGAVAGDDASGMAVGVGVWVAALGLLAVARRYETGKAAWSWPTGLALLMLVGVPPSPLFRLFYEAFENASWTVQVVYGLGLMFSVASAVRGSTARAGGCVEPPYARRWLPMAAGYGVVLLSLMAISRAYPVPAIAVVPMASWATACAAGFALAVAVGRVRLPWREVRAVLEIADLKWLYRSGLQGANNLLGVVRAASEVVEGNGSVLWSIVIILLVLMIVGYR